MGDINLNGLFILAVLGLVFAFVAIAALLGAVVYFVFNHVQIV